ncbi:MAG: hypothetical protein U1F81_14895 [Verrucomicrobiaceae bacterium]
MSDLPSKPQMPKPAPNSFWGLLWIVSSIVLPALIGALIENIQSDPPDAVFWGVPAVVLIMHATASTMICRHSLGLGILAFFFGWILIAGSFFIGCCANFSL